MQILSVQNLYIGYDEDKFCDFSIHLGNLMIEYQCPNAKNNGTVQTDDQSGNGETSEGNGAIQEP